MTELNFLKAVGKKRDYMAPKADNMQRIKILFICAIGGLFGQMVWASTLEDRCYFSIDNETIFDGPCNEKLSEIEANFATSHKQFIPQVISAGGDFSAYILEEEEPMSPDYYEYEPALFKVYWTAGEGMPPTQQLLGFGRMSSSFPRCISETKVPKGLVSRQTEMQGYENSFKVCWNNLAEKDYSAKLSEFIAEARSKCAAAGGDLTIGFEAVTKIELNADNTLDEVLSYQDLKCSMDNEMFSSRSDEKRFAWIIDDSWGTFISSGWTVEFPLGELPVFSMNLHGAFCDAVRSKRCEKSYMWNANTNTLEEVIHLENTQFVELEKEHEMTLTIKPFGCDTERCKEFLNCKINGELKRCLYGSGSAITGGITFESGQFFYIEWLTEHWNSKGELIKNKRDRYFALVNGKKSLFEDSEDCLTFLNETEEVIFGYGENCTP